MPGPTRSGPPPRKGARPDGLDALEPGPGGAYPAFPRDALGPPLWSDSAATDGVQVDGVTPCPEASGPRAGLPST